VIAPQTRLTDALRVLVDPTRLRILGLLEQGELTVGELARALGMAQSRVSNHLRVLRDARLLDERHVGRTTYLQLASSASTGAPTDVSSRLWSALRPEIRSLPEFPSDMERLQGVLRDRARGSADFFDRVAGEWDKIGIDFRTGQARQRAAASLLPSGLVFADLGCGTGYMSRGLAGLCSRLVCVDRSQGMLDEAARKIAPYAHGCQIEFRRGEMDALPIADGELDGCTAAMVLHHLPTLQGAVAEMYRVLKPDGRAVVLELAPHKEQWLTEELGDRHLGLESRDVMRAFERAGFTDVRLEPVEDHYEPKHSGGDEGSRKSTSLPLYIVRARKPARA